MKLRVVLILRDLVVIQGSNMNMPHWRGPMGSRTPIVWGPPLARDLFFGWDPYWLRSPHWVWGPHWLVTVVTY